MTDGFGLTGIRERVELLAATLDIRSASGEGTIVTVATTREAEAANDRSAGPDSDSPVEDLGRRIRKRSQSLNRPPGFGASADAPSVFDHGSESHLQAQTDCRCSSNPAVNTASSA